MVNTRSRYEGREFFRYQMPPLLWMVTIFVSSSIPEADYPAVGWGGWAKIVHLIFYSVLCFLTWRAMHHQRRFEWLARHSASVGLAVAVVYGSLDEFHQFFTVGRHPRATDVMIDAIGACLFLLALQCYRFYKKMDDTAY